MSTTDIDPPSRGQPFGGARSNRDRSYDSWSDNDRDTSWDDDRGASRRHRSRHDRHRSGPGFLARTEMWLDERGKPAWITAMILGFVFFWPVGLALLAYMIWSKRMCSTTHRSDRKRSWFNSEGRARHSAMQSAARPSGNAAFDSYKTETLRRLEEEQSSFEDFLGRLREAKDKAEFDQFMDDRARAASRGAPSNEAAQHDDGPHGDAAPEPDRYGGSRRDDTPPQAYGGR